MKYLSKIAGCIFMMGMMLVLTGCDREYDSYIDIIAQTSCSPDLS